MHVLRYRHIKKACIYVRFGGMVTIHEDLPKPTTHPYIHWTRRSIDCRTSEASLILTGYISIQLIIESLFGKNDSQCLHQRKWIKMDHYLKKFNNVALRCSILPIHVRSHKIPFDIPFKIMYNRLGIFLQNIILTDKWLVHQNILEKANVLFF